MATAINAHDPKEREAAKARVTAHYQAANPEPKVVQPAKPLTPDEINIRKAENIARESAGLPPVGETPAPKSLTPSVPLTEEQTVIASEIGADVQGLAAKIGAPAGEVQSLFDFGVTLAVGETVDYADPGVCETVLRTEHGMGADALIDDARRAVQSLGPGVAEYLNVTGLGNSPSVVTALAYYHWGLYKLKPSEARERLAKGGHDRTMGKLLAMLATREG
jgi:hypothetical protein